MMGYNLETLCHKRKAKRDISYIGYDYEIRTIKEWSKPNGIKYQDRIIAELKPIRDFIPKSYRNPKTLELKTNMEILQIPSTYQKIKLNNNIFYETKVSTKSDLIKKLESNFK